jgi:hypothetical protein
VACLHLSDAGKRDNSNEESYFDKVFKYELLAGSQQRRGYRQRIFFRGKYMKKSIMICTLAMLMAAFGSTAKAVTENPANWTFQLETYGAYVSWLSDSNVPKDFPQYDYDWQLTQAELKIEGEDLPGGFQWIPILGSLPEEQKSGIGSESELPITISGPPDPPLLHIQQEGITAYIYLGVTGDGYGSADMLNITFSQVGEYDVTGALFSGDFNVTAVPEPATILLLGLGSLVLLRRRRA